MSYDIELVDPVTKKVLELTNSHFMRGGTYAVDGTTDASFNITYNYSKIFHEVLSEENGIRFIYGKTGAESISCLTEAISKLSDDVDPDYWKATEGNAKKALHSLLALAQMRPDGIWVGD